MAQCLLSLFLSGFYQASLAPSPVSPYAMVRRLNPDCGNFCGDVIVSRRRAGRARRSRPLRWAESLCHRLLLCTASVHLPRWGAADRSDTIADVRRDEHFISDVLLEADIVAKRVVATRSMANVYEVHHSLCPPLTCTVSPVRKPASCVARNATTAAISSAFPIRRRTLRSIMAFSASGLLFARSICVSTMPGATATTRMPRGPSFRDRLMVSDSSAAFMAL